MLAHLGLSQACLPFHHVGVVRSGRVELPRPHGRRHLKPARLPFRHERVGAATETSNPAFPRTERACRLQHLGGMVPVGRLELTNLPLIERPLRLELHRVCARDGNRTRLTRSTAGQPRQMLPRAGSEWRESNSRLRFVGPRPSLWATLRCVWLRRVSIPPRRAYETRLRAGARAIAPARGLEPP
jgi:hypothetical protein